MNRYNLIDKIDRGGNMKGKVKKIVMTSLVVLIMTPSIVGARFVDMPNNWSTKALEEAVHNGLIQGYNGKILPDEPLTRAQFATIMARSLGLKDQANISKYKDVPKAEWYHDDMARAVYARIFEGDHERLHPERNVTREEAFTALGRAFVLEGEINRLNRFKDGDQVANWAQYSINGLIEGGYISGDHLGRLNPRKEITRAEFAKIMDNIVKEYVTRPGIYNNLNERGNVLVNRAEVTLKDMILKGDVVIADGVADDEVTLSNMDLRGRLVIRGSSKINIIDNSKIEDALVVNKLGESYIYVEKGSRINLIVLKSKTQIVGDGRVDKIHVSKDADGSKIEVDGAEVTVEEGANNVTDKHGDQIKPGETTDLDQGGEDSKAEALANLIEARREATKMRNADLNAVVGQYSRVNDKSSIAEINRATNAIESKIAEIRRVISARLKSYEKPIEAEVRKIPKQDSPANLEREINRVLRTYIKAPIKAQAQYVLVESKMEITLEESTVEHKFGIRLGAKDFVDPEKVSLYERLGEALNLIDDMDDSSLRTIVQDEEYEELYEKLYREQTSVTESPTNLAEVRSKVVRLEKAVETRRDNILANLKDMGLLLEKEAQDYDPVSNDQKLELVLRESFKKIATDKRSKATIPENGMRRNDARRVLEVTIIESNIEHKFTIGLKNVNEIDDESLLKVKLEGKLKLFEDYIVESGNESLRPVLEEYKSYTSKNNNVEARLIQNAIDDIDKILADYSGSKDKLKATQKILEDKIDDKKLQGQLRKKINNLGKDNYELVDIKKNLNGSLDYLLGKDVNDGGLVELLLSSAEKILSSDKDKSEEEINSMWSLLKEAERDINRLEEGIREVEEKIEEIDKFIIELPSKIQERAKSRPSSEENLRNVVEIELGNYKTDSIKDISEENDIYKLTIEGLRLDWDWKKDGKDYVIKLNEKIIIDAISMQKVEVE